jgi:hypothetical protein
VSAGGVCTTPAGALARRAALGARCSRRPAPPLGRSPPRPITSRPCIGACPIESVDCDGHFVPPRNHPRPDRAAPEGSAFYHTARSRGPEGMRLALDVLEGQNFAWVNHCGVGPCRASAPQLARSSPIIRAACRSLELDQGRVTAADITQTCGAAISFWNPAFCDRSHNLFSPSVVKVSGQRSVEECKP